MSNILLAPSEKVVDAQHVVAGLDESVAEVRAKEASPTSHQDSPARDGGVGQFWIRLLWVAHGRILG